MMEKKVYIVPQVKLCSADSEAILAASAHTTLTGKAATQSINDGYADTKPHYCVWDSDEYQ